MKYFFLILTFFALNSFSQENLLQSGPMVGYAEMREVLLWVQTKKAAEVKIRYQNVANKSQVFWTNVIKTRKESGFTAKLLADSVEAGAKYEYELFINNQKINLSYKTEFQSLPIWKFRTEPPNFSFATGSGTYVNEEKYDRPGKGYGGEYEIFPKMLEKKPDFMIWLGDNIYLREADWGSWTGIVHRYTHTRSFPQMQAFLASVHQYAIWDDHDAGDNDTDGSFWKKDETLKAFELFWANTSYGFNDMKGTMSFFRWNDVDFIMLDNRYYREPNKKVGENKTQLGKQQLEWLKNSLATSEATFKFVVLGGQFLTSVKDFETYMNNGFQNERQEIIDFIVQNNIKNVIFLVGDRHYSEMSVLKKQGQPTIYEATISPLLSTPSYSAVKEKNDFRVEGTAVFERNFGIFEVSDTFKNRKITIRCFSVQGKELWNYVIEKEN